MTSKQATQATAAKPVLYLGADLSPAVAAIERAYRMFQKVYTDAPDVTIVVKRDERAWGHTTVAKVWAPAGTEAADRFEIMISGENLRRGPVEVVSTLLHEAAHARNLAKGILDTDTNGRHNKVFADTAKEHGLDCQCNGWHGWNQTSMTLEGAKRWARMIKVVEVGLAKSGASARPSIDHLPKPEAPTAKPVTGVKVTPGGGLVVPPRRGNRNLTKATCGCGHSIRVSAGVLAAAQPTCQVCQEVFTA